MMAGRHPTEPLNPQTGEINLLLPTGHRVALKQLEQLLEGKDPEFIRQPECLAIRQYFDGLFRRKFLQRLEEL